MMRLLTGPRAVRAASIVGAVLLAAILIGVSVLAGRDRSAPPRASAPLTPLNWSSTSATRPAPTVAAQATPAGGGKLTARAGQEAAGGAGQARAAGRRPVAGHAQTPVGAAATGPRSRESVRAAATAFDGVFFDRKPAATWDMLTARAKRLIPEGTWIQVHNGCRPASAAAVRTVSSVTVFGDTAIVTETATAGTRHHRDFYVLSYERGRWGYSPDSLGLYHHGSISADIAAAKAAGLCGGWKVY